MSDVIILLGTEKYLIDKEIAPLFKQYLDDSTRSFNYDKFHGDDSTAARVIEACQPFPVMAEKRVVHVLRGELWKKQEDLDTLATYFANPNPSTCLILEIAKLDSRFKVWKEAQKKGFVREVKSPSVRELPQWIEQRARARGLILAEGVAHLIGEEVGVQLGLIEIELEKISLSIHPRNKIEIQDIEALVGKHLIHTIFEFVDKFADKKIGAAGALMDEMLMMGETLPGMLALIGRHFRLLLLTKEALLSGTNEYALAGLLKLPPFVAKRYSAQSVKITLPALKKLYQKILTTDRLIKSSRLNKRLIMDDLLLEYAV